MTEPVSLDPEDWAELRALDHRMVDDMIDYLAEVRARPVWQAMPTELRAELGAGLPERPVDAATAYADFLRLVQPYGTGNVHPGFMGWVHGGGNPVGMLAELLAGGLNANLGGRDHAPIEVERQVIRWTAAILGLPAQTSGLLVTGSSIANMIAVLVARTATLGEEARRTGLRGARLTAYSSQGAHGCIPRALDMAGLGSDSLRAIPCDGAGRMDLGALRKAVERDRDGGGIPFLVVGTAGTVNTGAVDDLAALARFCRTERIWFHVDGAFGAMAALSPVLRPLVAGIEQADSVALDFHKWAQVPYDAGCILVRDPEAQLAAFAQPAVYLHRETRGWPPAIPGPAISGPISRVGFAP